MEPGLSQAVPVTSTRSYGMVTVRPALLAAVKRLLFLRPENLSSSVRLVCRGKRERVSPLSCGKAQPNL